MCDGPLTGIHHLCRNPETEQHESTSEADLTRPLGWSQQWWRRRLSQPTQHSLPCRAPPPCPSALWTWPSRSPPYNGGLLWSPPLCRRPHGTSRLSVHESSAQSPFLCDDLLGSPSQHGARVGNSALGSLHTELLGVNGQSQVRDHVANQGGEL